MMYSIWLNFSSSVPALPCPLLNIVPLQNFGEYDMWLAAENGMFLRCTKGKWMTTMPEHLTMDWADSVKVHTESVVTCSSV